MSENKLLGETHSCYKKYYEEKGADRNDVLCTPGVLFQKLAKDRAEIRALGAIGLSKDWKVLDVGCGGGTNLASLLHYGITPEQLYGIDLMPSRIEEAQSKYPNISFHCCDASKAPFEDGFFDLITESTMFLQLPSETLAEDIAAEMIRLVKPGGYIMLTDWRYDFWRPGYTGLPMRRIKRLFLVGTETKVVRREHGPLLPPLGRFLSAYAGPLYFLLHALLPILAGQMTTVLQKTASPAE